MSRRDILCRSVINRYISFRQERCVLKDTLIIEPSKAGYVAQGRNELKDEQLFARLIGAAVLLALAVIVLPFVLDGSGSQREYEYAETLPVEPERPDVIEKSFSSRQTALENQRAPTREEVHVTSPPTTSTVSMQAPARSTINSTTESSPRTTAELTSAVATAAQGTANTTPAAVAGSAIQSLPLQAGWNIQVASFVRDANAIKLIKKLRARNLPAYANRISGSTRTVIRVLVGPYPNQIDALALQNRIDKDYRVESLMVRGR